MCECLVKVSTTNAYQANDVVVIKPDGWGWSDLELDPSVFKVVKFPGETVNSKKFLLNPEIEQIRHSAMLNIPRLSAHIRHRDPIPVKRCRYALNPVDNTITDKTRP